MEAVVAAMGRFSTQTTVQLSALLCFIPLALENIMMQARHAADMADVAIFVLLYTARRTADVVDVALFVLLHTALSYGGCIPYCSASVM